MTPYKSVAIRGITVPPYSVYRENFWMIPSNQASDLLATKWVLAIVAAMWVSVPFAIRVLALLSLIDIVTSLFNPHRHLIASVKRVSLSLILSGTVHYVYAMAKSQTGLNLGFDLATMVASFYILGESIVIIQNCAEAGVAIPPVLLDTLSKAEGLTGAEKHEIEALKLKQGQEKVALELKITQDRTIKPVASGTLVD